MEAKLFDGPVAEVSTLGFHWDRERAPHLEQDAHRGRLDKAFELVRAAARSRVPNSGDQAVVVDLGCGDGGLLSLLYDLPHVRAHGYDFQPSNVTGWVERGVSAQAVNFVEALPEILATQPDIVVMTEVLEHLTDPHGVLRQVRASGADLVCSSPWTETYASHDACHAWAWDRDGYAALVTGAGFEIADHVTVSMFQVILAVSA